MAKRSLDIFFWGVNLCFVGSSKVFFWVFSNGVQAISISNQFLVSGCLEMVWLHLIWI